MTSKVSDLPTDRLSRRKLLTIATALGGTSIFPTSTVGKSLAPPTTTASSPTILGETAFIGNIEGLLQAIDITTGDTKWVFETSNSIVSSPTIVNNSVVIGGSGEDGTLYAIDVETGEKQWTFETNGAVRSSPTVVDDTIFVGSDDPNLYAVDAKTGDQKWAVETGDNGRSSPTAVNDTVFIGSADTNLYAVNAETGKKEWVFQTGDVIGSSPTVANGRVFIGSADTNLYAVDVETGEEEWVVETEGRVMSSPTVAETTVFVGGGSIVYAIDTETGDKQWTFDSGEVYEEKDDQPAHFGSGVIGHSSPTVAGGTVFVGNSNGTIFAIDAETGREQQRFETEINRFSSSPTVVDGTVFIGLHRDKFFSVESNVDGSSSGSRVKLGTLGHHTNRSITVPGFGVGTALSGLTGASYLLHRYATSHTAE